MLTSGNDWIVLSVKLALKGCEEPRVLLPESGAWSKWAEPGKGKARPQKAQSQCSGVGGVSSSGLIPVCMSGAWSHSLILECKGREGMMPGLKPGSGTWGFVWPMDWPCFSHLAHVVKSLSTSVLIILLLDTKPLWDFLDCALLSLTSKFLGSVLFLSFFPGVILSLINVYKHLKI